MSRRAGSARLPDPSSTRMKEGGEEGFSLVEFLISSLVAIVVAAAIFGLMNGLQRTASYQMEVQGVLENTRMVMETVARIIQQAGNDPHGTGFEALTLGSAQELRIRSDLTGSAPGSPDQGDPDGDTADSGEEVTIHYNPGSRAVELVPSAGVAQPIASNISDFAMQCFDSDGAATIDGRAVRRIRVSVTGSSPLADPQTGKVFSLRLASDIRLANR